MESLAVQLGQRGRASRAEALRAGGRWVAERRLILGLGCAAALPCIIASVEAVASGWTVLGDNAYTAVNALDVLSTHPPLVGQWSGGATAVLDEPAYSPGPLLFWLLALPARLPEPSMLIVAVGLLNLASVIGIVGLAHRRGGRPLMLAVALAVPLMLAALPGEAHSDIWNSSAPLLPFLLLLFLAWSLACGEYRLLPVTVLVASFVAQAHLTFAPPALGAMAVGLAGLALSQRRITRRRSLRRWTVAAVAVAALCWSAPLAEQAVERPGNLVLLARAALADEPTAGIETGWRALVKTIGVVPWWLQDPDIPDERAAELRTAPGPVAVGSTAIFLLALTAVTAAGWRRRRGDVLAAGALGLVLCAALAQVAASTPEATFNTLGYTLRWASPAGMWVWIALGWSAATLLRPVPRALRLRRPALAAAAAVGLVAALGTVVGLSAERRPDPYDEMRSIGDRLTAEVPDEGRVRVDASLTPDTLFLGFMIQAGSVYSLRQEGRDVAAPSIAIGLGDHYGGEAHDRRVLVDVGEREEGGGRIVARLQARDPFVQGAALRRPVTVTLAPRGAD